MNVVFLGCVFPGYIKSNKRINKTQNQIKEKKGVGEGWKKVLFCFYKS